MKRAIFLLSISLMILAYSCATLPDSNAVTGRSDGPYRLIGKTRYQGETLSAGEITLSRAEPGGASYKTPVKEDGSFSIDLAPGPWFLMGSGLDPATGQNLFAYYINNPLRLYGDIKDPVVLPFVVSTRVPKSVQGEGISGKVTKGGEPVRGAVVAAFLDASGEFHGLPYAESGPSGSDGSFALTLGPGKYFLLARSRSTGASFQGPLLKGDLAGFYPHNPVLLRTGEGLVLNIPMVQINRPRGKGSLAHGEVITVAGRVTDVTGNPVSGVRVVLYNIPEMLGRPMFISSPTDKTGAYRLEVARSGIFYAAARSVIGRPAQTGELMGYYDGTDDHSIKLNMGDRVEGVDIVVREVW